MRTDTRLIRENSPILNMRQIYTLPYCQSQDANNESAAVIIKRMTRWLDPQPVSIPASFADLNLHPLVAQTLIRRGILTPNSAQAFLHPDTLPSTPFPNIETAVEIIQAAIQRNDRICVWGDFDVDGQ